MQPQAKVTPVQTPAAPELDPGMLRQIVELLVDAAQPKRIILFGSYARGDQTPESDLDLLITEESVADPAQESVRLRRALAAIRMPIDVLVYSEQELKTRGQWLGTAAYEALREGRQLYAVG